MRVFFHTLPNNGVTITNADGTGTFTASNQPYFEYSGARARRRRDPRQRRDVVDQELEVRPQRRVELHLPGATSRRSCPTRAACCCWTPSTVAQAARVENINAIWGASASDIWIAGTDGAERAAALERRELDALRRRRAGGHGRRSGEAASSDVYAVGGTKIQHWNGSAWADTATASTALLAIWGSSATDVYACGRAARSCTRAAARSRRVAGNPLGTEDCAAIWGTLVEQRLRRREPTSTTATARLDARSAPASPSVRAIWGTSATDIWIGGDWRQAWCTTTEPPGARRSRFGAADVGGIWGTSPSDVYMVNRGGSIWHYNGSNWVKYTTASDACSASGAAVGPTSGSVGADARLPVNKVYPRHALIALAASAHGGSGALAGSRAAFECCLSAHSDRQIVAMEIGFALTQHCNLRCPHCIRDDVTTVQSLSVELLASILEQSRALFGSHSVSFTGGEPLLHPRVRRASWTCCAEHGHPYRFVSNGWHLTRALRASRSHAPSAVRLSLSGATAEVHDAERGRGSFHRVLLASGVLTSRGIPTHLSLVIDSRTRTQLREAADLAESIGAHELHYILPQPVAASVMRDSDLALEAWDDVRREVDALAAEGRAHVRIVRDYGFPADGAERPCTTKARTRLFVDAWGRLVSCCQLSDYGFNDAEVVTDLHVTPLADALDAFHEHVDRLDRGERAALRRARRTVPLHAMRTRQRESWAGCAATRGARGRPWPLTDVANSLTSPRDPLSVSMNIPSEVLAAHLGDEAVLLDLTGKRYYRLNETAAVVFRALEEGEGREGAIRRLIAAFESASRTRRAPWTRCSPISPRAGSSRGRRVTARRATRRAARRSRRRQTLGEHVAARVAVAAERERERGMRRRVAKERHHRAGAPHDRP